MHDDPAVLDLALQVVRRRLGLSDDGNTDAARVIRDLLAKEVFRRSADGYFDVSQLSLKCNFLLEYGGGWHDGSSRSRVGLCLDHWQPPGALLRTSVALVGRLIHETRGSGGRPA